MRSDRLVPLVAFFVAAAGCAPSPFHCTRDSQCNASAVCAPPGYCAVRSAACASGLAFAASAAQPGSCVTLPADAGNTDVPGVFDTAPPDAGASDTPPSDAVTDVPAVDVPAMDGPIDAVPIDAPRDAAVDAPAADRGDAGDAADAPDVPADVPCTAPAPRLIAPISGSRIPGASADLRVAPGTGGVLEVSPSRSFARDVTTVLADASTGLVRLPPRSRGTYFWRARGRCPSGEIGSAGAVWSFWLRGGTAPAPSHPIGAAGFVSDLDGDGFADLAIGHPRTSDASGTRADAVEIVFGGAGSVPSHDGAVILAPRGAPRNFGAQVAIVPDMDGDGLSELAVSTCTHPAGDPCGGAVWIYPGTRDRGFATHWTLPPPFTDAPRFGESLAGVGDVNADGYGDLAVTALPNDFHATSYVQVYSGSPAGPVPGTTIARAAVTEGSVNVTLFGWSLAGPGDVDGDGLSDLVATSFERAWIYPGLAGGTALGDVVELTVGPAFEGTYGFTAAAAGDLDGDGLADIAVARPGRQNPGGMALSGDVAFFFGRPHGTDPWSGSTPAVGAAGSRFGLAMAGAAEANGDAFDDFLVGAPSDAGGAGSVTLFTGGTAVARAFATIGAAGAARGFGRSAATFGDYDGTGRDAFAVGAGAPGSTASSGSGVLVLRVAADTGLAVGGTLLDAIDPDFGTWLAARSYRWPRSDRRWVAGRPFQATVISSSSSFSFRGK